MGVRITELPSQPTMTSEDVFVIDGGQDGTRHTSIDKSLVLSGTIHPLPTMGIIGSIYVQYYSTIDMVRCVYFKTENGWVPSPSPNTPQE